MERAHPLSKPSYIYFPMTLDWGRATIRKAEGGVRPLHPWEIPQRRRAGTDEPWVPMHGRTKVREGDVVRIFGAEW